jgi:hypothetical protein
MELHGTRRVATSRAAVCVQSLAGERAWCRQTLTRGVCPNCTSRGALAECAAAELARTRGAYVVSPVLVLWKYATPVRGSAKRSQPGGRCVLLSMRWPSSSSSPSTAGSAAALAAAAAAVAGDVCDVRLSPTGSVGLSTWRDRSALDCDASRCVCANECAAGGAPWCDARKLRLQPRPRPPTR